MKKLMAVGALALAMVAVSRDAMAQSANITASAQVAQALTVSSNGNLDFGTVINGFNRTVAPADATSGGFSLLGGANAEVTLTFTLPANLAGPGGNLPISFGAGSAGWALTNSRVGLNTFDPSTGPGPVRLDGTSGEMYVFIGGTVAPVALSAGTYSATITLGAAYTGN
jgi:hypothetical protein